MIWKILIIIALLLSVYSTWGMWQNMKAIKSIFHMIDDLNDMIRKMVDRM